MAKKNTVVEVQYPEKGTFADVKELQKYIKPLTDEQIAEWVGLEGLEVKDYGSAPINRMRQIMAIKELHFPSEKKPSAKKESPYKKYSTEQLVEMAIDNNALFEPTEDTRILRMRAIMALRAAKVIE
ncbi:hypothetical protein D1872_51260 [compost metagenome]